MNRIAETVGFLTSLAVACGYRVWKVCRSRTGSVYLRLMGRDRRLWVIRVSGHRPSPSNVQRLAHVRLDKGLLLGFRKAVRVMLRHSTLAGGLDSLSRSYADRVPASSTVLPARQDLGQGIGAGRSCVERLYHHAMTRAVVRGSLQVFGTFGESKEEALPAVAAGP